MMKIEILYVDGCPHWQEAANLIRASAAAAGRPAVEIGYRRIATDAGAAASVFAGSPTILINGGDAFDNAVPVTELACRVYPTDAGLAGLPTVEQLAQALQRHS